MDNDEIIRLLAKEFKGRLSKCELYDANVCRVERDTPLIPVPAEGEPFRRRLRFALRGRKVTLFSNSTYIDVQVDGTFPCGVFSIGARSRVGWRSESAGMWSASGASLPVFTQDGLISANQQRLLERSELHLLVEPAALQEWKCLFFTRNQIHLYLERPALDTVCRVLQTAIDLADAEEILEDEAVDLKQLPIQFHPLIPLIQKWAISDDMERQDLLDSAKDSTLRRLLDEISPFVPAIDSYLDSFGKSHPTESACALGTLAELAVEIKLRLEGTPPSG